MKYLHLPLALAVLGFAGCATATAHPTNWDMNRDGYLDSDEYRTCLTTIGLFDEWDHDDGGFLTRDEFRSGLRAGDIDFSPAEDYSEWDQDGDGRLDPDEFHAGSWRAVDLDQDRLVSPLEFGLIGPALGLDGGIGLSQSQPGHRP